MTEAQRVRAYVGLGSNLNDPIAQVNEALVALDGIPQTQRLAQSGLYRSPPMGPPEQPDYINAVAVLETQLTAEELLRQLQNIEARQGRLRLGERWGPRTLDLDILLYGDLKLSRSELTVPHPGLPDRAFVLYPLLEVAPELVIPGLGSVAELAANCAGQGVVRLRDQT